MTIKGPFPTSKPGTPVWKLVDSWPQSYRTGAMYLYSGAMVYISQSFVGDGSTLHSAKFDLAWAVGSVTGNAYAHVWNITGTPGTNAKPLGAAIAVSDAFDVSVITAVNALYELHFSGVNKIVLGNGTDYCISFNFSGGDSSHRIIAGRQETGADTGNSARADAVPSWDTTLASKDTIYYVYGETTTWPY